MNPLSVPSLCTLAAGALMLLPAAPATRAAEAPSPALTPEGYDREVQPLLRRYCLDCHSTAKHKGDLDLERFSSLAEARRQPKIWQSAADQLRQAEMPPKEKPQPTDEERDRLLERITALVSEVARAQAGDPGPVMLRRLSNAEYTATIRDLTGVDALDPAREFPVDGAAGEGFMNTGNALVMSPALLTKYLDAARDLAAHAVLLPDGIRFSPSVSRRDWTDDAVARIRQLYRRYTDPRGSTRVNLQGLVWETNEGGRVPLERYFSATLSARDALTAGSTTIDAVAREHDLSPKYLGTLWRVLSASDDSPLFGELRARWRKAGPADAAALAEDVGRWQKALWKFSSVGHIGKVGGPRAWMEPVSAVTARQEVRLKIAPPAGDAEVRLRLAAREVLDSAATGAVVWERPRFVAAGRPELPLRELRSISESLLARRARMLASVSECLAAATEVEAATESGTALGADELAALARRHGADPAILDAWLSYLGLGRTGPARIEGYFTNRLVRVAGFDSVSGWGSPDTPSLMANASDQALRIPGNLRAHGVVVHPSPTLQAAVGWRSPVTTRLRVTATVGHAHPECGNGVTWTLEIRRGATRQRFAAGVSQGGKPVPLGPFDEVAVRAGDVIALLVGPRDGNHSCDLTAVDLMLTATGADAATSRVWDLAADVSGDVGTANPHADRQGNDGVWHFFAEPDSGRSDSGVVIPAGSTLAQWRSTRDAGHRAGLAKSLASQLQAPPVAGATNADAVLIRELRSLGGPWFRGFLASVRGESDTSGIATAREKSNRPGLDPARFGSRNGLTIAEATSLVTTSGETLETEVPADLVAGTEFVTAVTPAGDTAANAGVQLDVGIGRVGEKDASKATPTGWSPDAPVIAAQGGAAWRRIEAAFDGFREVFPAALAYTRIVPVDEVVTLTLFYREDDALRRLMLDDTEAARLDRLWDELRFVSQDALTLVDAFAQLMEYATQDADPKVFEPLRKPIQDRAAAFRRTLVESEPRHLTALVDFAARAWRRPLTGIEVEELRGLYAKLRSQELPHEDAFRMTLARVLVAPAFLYRAEQPGPGTEQVPVSDWELATRLSYFLWSSLPDDELRSLAASGKLREPATLLAQLHRMVRDDRVRRLATEFGCQWLNVHGFDEIDEKSERHFPTFAGLKGAMYEEAIRFFAEFFRNDGTVHGLLDGDSVFVNEAMARHYGIPGVSGPEWRRVEDARRYGRGGILGLSATLAKESGASRTSPILRGNWVSEVLLGEKLPRPPKDVPRLPEDEAATEGKTVRQLVERHSSDPRCSGCHVRIDPYGFALESYDAIGRHRTRDLADRPVETRAKTADGSEFEGAEGLQRYLLTKRGDAFRRQFCRKLLGYALGRAIRISDQPLLDEIQAKLAANGERVNLALESIVLSRQFREIRGRKGVYED